MAHLGYSYADLAQGWWLDFLWQTLTKQLTSLLESNAHKAQLTFPLRDLAVSWGRAAGR